MLFKCVNQNRKSGNFKPRRPTQPNGSVFSQMLESIATKWMLNVFFLNVNQKTYKSWYIYTNE